MTALIALPFDLEAAIAEAAKASIERMRAAPPPTEAEEVEIGRKLAEMNWWLPTLDKALTVALTPVAVLGVGAVYELKMMGMI